MEVDVVEVDGVGMEEVEVEVNEPMSGISSVACPNEAAMAAANCASSDKSPIF